MNRSHLMLCTWITVILSGCLLSFCGSTWAGSGQVISTPPPGVINISGLRLDVDTQWVDGSGYRDLRIHLATATGAPSTIDRELRIEIAANSYRNSENKRITWQHVTLPQGDATVTAHLLVPQNRPWQQVEVRVYENGRRWKKLSSRTSINNNVGDEWSEAIPSILVIDAAAPPAQDRTAMLVRYNRDPKVFQKKYTLADVRALEALVKRSAFHSDSDGKHAIRDMEILRRISTTPRLELLAPSDLPDRWIGLTSLDLIIIDFNTLEAMSQNNSSKFKTVVDWAAAGGNLIVHSVGKDYQQLSKLETLLKLFPKTKEDGFQEAGWRVAQQKNFHNRAVTTYQQMQIEPMVWRRRLCGGRRTNRRAGQATAG